jgi:LuxR family maltose regulon positive regulatory protein
VIGQGSGYEGNLVREKILNLHILHTKLNRRAVDSKWIQRPRLITRLDEGLKNRLTLISAPAGYGKTTLAVQWINHIPGHSAWLSLDKKESDPDRFLRYVIASIRTVVLEFGANTEPLLLSPNLPPPDYLADAMVSDLAMLKKPLVVVFDDYHTIVSDEVQKTVSRMVQHLPENIHFLISTRIDTPWPLGLWRARQWLTELRAADLRFSKEEAQFFFVRRVGKPFATEVIDRIQSRTEGWIAGLQLACLSLADEENPEQFARSFSGSDRQIVDFLMDEVFSRQPAEIKNFLYVSAMIERFCAPLCDFISKGSFGKVDSGKFIAKLDRENLFLVPLDNERRWYRYHHLFQSLLMQHLKENLSPKRKTQIHQLAGEWFAGQGLIEEALRHLIAADDIDAAAALVEENLGVAIDNDLSRRTLGRWLDMFPKSAEKQQPTLLVAHAYCKLFRWDFAGMLLLLDNAEALLRNPAGTVPEYRFQRLLGNIDVQRTWYLFWQGDAEGSLQHGRRALKVVPKDHHYTHSLAVVYTAGSLAIVGRRDEALHLLEDALTETYAEGSRNVGGFLTAQAVIHYYGGNFNDVKKSAERMLTIHESVPLPDYYIGYAHYLLGNVAYERNLLDTAADHFRCAEQLRYRIMTRVYHDALIGLSLVAWARGEVDVAKEYAVSARNFAVEVNDPYSLKISDSFETRLAIFSGEVSVKPEAYSPTVDSNRFWLEVPSLTRAEYLINKATPKDCSTGLECTEDALQRAEQHHNTRQIIQFLAANAVALKCAGNLEGALEVLEETLHMAEPLGFVRTFLDRGPVMAELLNALLERGHGSPYIRRILTGFGDKKPSEMATVISSIDQRSQAEQVADAILSSELSNREIEVLNLLEMPLTNKEIAQRLFISPETVKKHNFNIYRKLVVHGRRQAVATAKKLGLLSPKD